MFIGSPRGFTLAELLVALILLSGLALATAPLAARSGALLGRGRSLLEGVHMASSRRALSDSLPCTSASGTDNGQRARLEWRLLPRDSSQHLTAVIRDPGGRWPPETLATVLPCVP